MIDATPNVGNLQAGNRFEFTGLDTLHEFETMLAPIVDPSYHKDYWTGRVLLATMIQDNIQAQGAPTDISNISLRVMNAPYEKLSTAQDEGWITKVSAERYHTVASEFVGFELDGDVRRRAPSETGSFESLLWYAPIPGRRDISVHRRDSAGKGIVRILAKPKVTIEVPAQPINLDGVKVTVASRGVLTFGGRKASRTPRH